MLVCVLNFHADARDYEEEQMQIGEIHWNNKEKCLNWRKTI